jgi:dATP/dGTP diphosphohydrolase, N-terminal
VALPTDPQNSRAAERKKRPMFRGLFRYFPNALEAISHVSYVGNEQHNPGQEIHWDKSKSADDADALLRHLDDYAKGQKVDSDGLPVLAKVGWRALAILQREIEQEQQEETYVPPKIGKRTLLKFLGFKWVGKSYQEGRWLVRCDCGREFECGDANHDPMWFGLCASCGQATPKPSRRKRPFEAQYNAFVGKAKRPGRSSRAVRHQVFITYEEFAELAKQKECHYCGAPVIWCEYGRNSTASNLDRKDSRLPYTLDNVVVCCKRCNIGKNRWFSYEEWKQIGSLIRDWYAKEKTNEPNAERISVAQP